LGAIFENIVLNKLKKLSPDCILAAADNRAITEYIKRTNFKAEVGTIIPFPTRVDDEIFYPTENIEALRIKLDIKAPIVFTVVGRLSAIKGWHLLIDAFEIFKKTYPDSFLVFVGGGEDRDGN
jgi:glycosyltransferase involved in cell wall biosynthesis